MSIKWIAAIVVTLFASISTSQAAVNVGGRLFSDNAFADAVSFPVASYAVWDGVTSNVMVTFDAGVVRGAMLDTPLTLPGLAESTFGACNFGQSEQDCGLVQVSFLDNQVMNGPGDDFTIFDINSPGAAKVTIDGVTVIRNTVLAGAVPRPGSGAGVWDLNAADFDLTDFGLVSGATVDSLSVHWGYGETSDVRIAISLVGALQPVPEPAMLALLMAGFAVVIGAARHRA